MGGIIILPTHMDIMRIKKEHRILKTVTLRAIVVSITPITTTAFPNNRELAPSSRSLF